MLPLRTLQKYIIRAQGTFLRKYKGDKMYQNQIYKLLNDAYDREALATIAESASCTSGRCNSST